MGDSEATLISVEHWREPLGTDGSDVSAKEIQAVRDQTDALAHLLIDISLDQQRKKDAAS